MPGCEASRRYSEPSLLLRNSGGSASVAFGKPQMASARVYVWEERTENTHDAESVDYTRPVGKGSDLVEQAIREFDDGLS